MNKLIALLLLTLSFNAFSGDWYKNKKHIGSSEGFDLYITRTVDTKVTFKYALELRGKNKGCKALPELTYIDLRWGGYLYKCTDIKNGLVIVPSTRSGRSMFTNVIEHTRTGDYLEVSGITTKPLIAKLK